MTGIDLVQLLTTGSGTAILAAAVWAFLTGRIIPRSTFDEAMQAKDEEIARSQRREAEVWNLLKQTTGLVNYTATVADRATRVAEAQIEPEPPRWTDTQTELERRPPRPRRPPKGAPL